MPVKINGSTSGSVTLAAPATGSDVTLTLPAATGTAATSADVTSAVAPMGLVAVAPTSIANSGGSASLSNYTVSFSGVSSVSLNGVFTGDYDNYRIAVSITSQSASSTNSLRLRAAGSDTSTSTYTWGQGRAGRTSLSDGIGQTSVSSFSMGYNASGYLFTGAFDIFRANISGQVGIQGQSYGYDSGPVSSFISGVCTQATAHDGLTIYPSSGTITGTVSVYGYKK